MRVTSNDQPDVVLIGAGVMSATTGVLLKELEPSLSIVMFETLEDCGQESSDAWNNAGTGHAANCEMNYTPQRPGGTVDISKHLKSTSSSICRGSYGAISSRRAPSRIRARSFIPYRI